MRHFLKTFGDALRNAPVRFACFFGFWLVLSGIKPADLLIGALAAGCATWVSLRALPPGRWRFRPRALGRFVWRFLRQSVGAGVDVARRALDPRMPLRPGFVVYRSQLPAGVTRNTFCTVTSLLPGTLPCGSDPGDGVLIHCLDIDQPVLAQLAAEKSLFAQITGGAVHND